MAMGRPVAFKTVDELEKAIDYYFANGAYMGEGDERVYAPTMAGLSRSLKIDRKTLVNYGKKEDFFLTVSEARAKVEEFLEQKLYGTAVTGVIFNLKNNFSWKDKSEVSSTNVEMTHEEWIKSLE